VSQQSTKLTSRSVVEITGGVTLKATNILSELKVFEK
jgi:hypothetical protein